jgi:hypothetical protein
MVKEAEPLTCVREYPYSTGGLLETQGNAMPELALAFWDVWAGGLATPVPVPPDCAHTQQTGGWLDVGP